MLLYGGHSGGLEIRRSGGGGARLSGRFSYGKAAVLSDGGRTGKPRKEIVAARAFAYRVEDPAEDVHFLVGHDFGAPLASKLSGTLNLTDTDAALQFEARIAPEMADVSWVRDALASIEAGLAVGVSPGFRIPPARAVANAEEITQEPNDPAKGMHGAIIRTIRSALLFELSLVVRPAYPDTQVEARNWEPTESGVAIPKQPALARWRL